jgi:glycosyltransferase involved in cell wall biosynthesis
MKNNFSLTIIVPSYNESNNITPLYERVKNSFIEYPNFKWKILYIENGSTDGSLEILQKLHLNDQRASFIRLSRNFGYQGAITAGLSKTTSDWVAIMDGDIQDPPELIPKMLQEAIYGNYDVVYGIKKSRQESFIKRLLYKSFYYVYEFFSEIEIPRDSGEFSVFNKTVARTLNSFHEKQRFTRGLRTWIGFKQAPFYYDREARYSGESHFTFSDMIKLATDGILSFSITPLRISFIMGTVILTISSVLIFLQALNKFFEYFNIHLQFLPTLPPGLTQLTVLVIFLFALLFSTLGIIGEYIGRIYYEVKNRPNFIIEIDSDIKSID